jgi:protein tyrosine phosphatase (PTP) superfamily phosphohydrolase (DUF442 family)
MFRARRRPVVAARVLTRIDSRAALAVLALASACWMLGLLVAARAGAEPPITPDDVKGPMTWGAATRVTHLRHLYFADQPDAAGFEAAKQAGVLTVIDLRAPGERDWDERALVEGLGLAYYNVPVEGGAFDRAAFERIEALVAQAGPEPILLHCSSSNRVGGWLATHLVTRHGLSEEEALAVGRRAGITKEPIERSVEAYLEKLPEPPPSS